MLRRSLGELDSRKFAMKEPTKVTTKAIIMFSTSALILILSGGFGFFTTIFSAILALLATKDITLNYKQRLNSYKFHKDEVEYFRTLDEALKFITNDKFIPTYECLVMSQDDINAALQKDDINKIQLELK